MPNQARPRLCRIAGRDAWHIYDQRRRISTGCTSRAEAELVLARYVEGDNRTRLPVTSIGMVLDRYLQNRRDRAIPGLARLEWAHKALRRFWGERPPEVVTEDECLRYGRRRAEDQSGPHDKPASPATVRTELQALRAALRWATAEKLIEAAPSVLLPSRPPARERWLTREQAGRLLAACGSPHIRLFTQIALRSAARKTAILSLRWDRVDLERRLIDFRIPGQAQTRKRRVAVPINDTLLEALSIAKAAAETDYVIEWAGGRVKDIKHGFRDAVARAGLKGITPHSLRHTAATWMAQGGVPLWEIAGFLGHSDVAMVAETYGHHDPAFLGQAARSLV